jgi:hypothetical protein
MDTIDKKAMDNLIMKYGGIPNLPINDPTWRPLLLAMWEVLHEEGPSHGAQMYFLRRGSRIYPALMMPIAHEQQIGNALRTKLEHSKDVAALAKERGAFPITREVYPEERESVWYQERVWFLATALGSTH